MWKAYDIRKKEGVKYNIAQTLGHIADIQFLIKDFREAEIWALKSIEVSESINAHYLTKMAFEILHKTYFELSDFEKAYTVLTKKMAIELLLIKEEQEDRLKLVSTKYKFKLKQEHETAEVAKKNYMLLVLFVLSVLVSSILFFFYKKKEAKGIQDSLLNEKLELQNKLLGEELDFKNKEVMTKVMYLVKKNELIESIVKRLVILRSSLKNENRQEVFSIVRELRNETSTNDVWEEFETYFNTIQSDFYARLNESYELSQNERRLSAFLKLDMTTKEISTISGQTIRSIEVARYRLRKKLNIPKELGINEFLATV